MDRPLAVPFESILPEHSQDKTSPESAAHPLVDQADVIYAVDASKSRDILVFGRDKLTRIATSDLPEGARVLRVTVGAERHKLQRLVQLVKGVKGSVDYAEPA